MRRQRRKSIEALFKGSRKKARSHNSRIFPRTFRHGIFLVPPRLRLFTSGLLPGKRGHLVNGSILADSLDRTSENHIRLVLFYSWISSSFPVLCLKKEREKKRTDEARLFSRSRFSRQDERTGRTNYSMLPDPPHSSTVNIYLCYFHGRWFN